jgi:type IV pilus assembly protein PilA
MQTSQKTPRSTNSTNAVVLPIRAYENAYQRSEGGVEMLKALQNRMKDDKGFTLIELMVVVLIIAILIAIAIPTFLGLRERAQNRAAQSDLRNGLTAAKAHYTDNETFGDGAAGVPDFDEANAEAIEPSIDFEAAGSTTVVGIVVASGNDLLLTRQSQSDDWFCAVEAAGVSSVRGPGAAAAADQAACLALPAI